MKINLLKSCCGGLLAGAMLLAAGPAPEARAQNTNLLVGTAWDCVLTGQRSGTALFQFNPDGTFTVDEIMVPNAPASPGSSSTDRGGSNVGRNSGGGSTNTFVPNPQIFGEEQTNGFWAFDPKGHVIGFFVEVSSPLNCTITAVPISTNTTSAGAPTTPFTNGAVTDPTFCVTSTTATNGSTFTDSTVCFTNVEICANITNAISFVGTLSPTHLNLNCTTPFGNTMFRGVPAPEVPLDISGTYSGVRMLNGVTYQEFFTLTGSGPFFSVSLNGPGYSYTGNAMLSSQKRIAFALDQTPVNPTNTQITVVRAVTGPFRFKANASSANTQGWDGEQGNFQSRVHFNIQQLP